MIKAAFFDIDGTLLSHELGCMPPSAAEALRLLRDHGVKIFTATGRGIQEILALDINDVPFDGYVTMNGQVCLDGDRNIVFSAGCEPEDAALCIDAFDAREVPMALAEGERFYINYIDAQVRQILRDVCLPEPPVDVYLGGELLGAVIYDPGAPALDFVKKLKHCRLSQWHSRAYDVIPLGGGKAMGVRRMLEMLGIDEKQTAVFGDADNDLEMMEMAGISVAMGNGEPAVKDRADMVTDDLMNDGVYKAVVKLLAL